MFGIGFWEAVFCGTVGFMILGPEKLASSVREVLRGGRALQRIASRLGREVSKELDEVKQVGTSAFNEKQFNIEARKQQSNQSGQPN